MINLLSITYKDAWFFYCIFGLFTITLGIIRNFQNKNETDELNTLAWFLIWFVYLPTFIVSSIVKKIKKSKWNQKA